MKTAIVLLAAAPFVIGAAPADHAADPQAVIWNLHAPEPDHCERTIRSVNDANGRPALDRGTAASQKPPLIAAVDYRVNGCSALVLTDGSLRPFPEPDGKPELRPAG